jgi:hypothetical protein
VSESFYLQIKKLAKESGRSYKDFIALAPQNDPFYSGAKANKRNAEWFAALWEQFGFTDGAHLRRIHYALLDKEGFLNSKGEPYINTENQWQAFCCASKHARYLGLVSPDLFKDKRNPEGHFYFYPFHSIPEPSYFISPVGWHIPSCSISFPDSIGFNSPNASVEGYDYNDNCQKYHIEIWCEKSTQDDILLPIGEKYGINIITSVGFQSITRETELCKRVADIGKPCRIFYISDFDKAGDGMPIAVARQIEYWFREYAPDADIKLEALALTREQVDKYNLPRTPLKNTVKGKEHWEESHGGEGGVELDALEGRVPGELKRIIEKAIAPYRDMELQDELSDTYKDAQEEVDNAIEEVWNKYKDPLEEIANQVKEISKKYDAEAQEIKKRFETDIAPFRDKIESYKDTIGIELNSMNLNVDLPERPEAECIDEDDEKSFLFDSSREYGEQLAYYKQKQAGDGNKNETEDEDE